MADSNQFPDPVERLRDAMNSHDAHRVAACFTPDYRSEVPLHPGRGFVGTGHVLHNWAEMFARVPDLAARILRATTDGEVTWTEWELTGTTPTGDAVVFTGPVILTVRDGLIAWTRFYLDAVQPDPA